MYMYHHDQLRREGDLGDIMRGFASASPVSKLQAISGSINHNVYNKSIREELNRLTDDQEIILGYHISQLAIAALHRFENTRYEGDDVIVQRLIEAPKWSDK